MIYILTLEQFLTNNKFIELNSDTFYHQTTFSNATNILKNNFLSTIHQGQARFTHGIYFLNHPNGRYGECTLSAEISGKFLDFTQDEFGDDWIEFRDSFDWNDYDDLTINVREKYPNCDGILFNHLLVVWYPEKTIKNIQKK